MNYKLFRKSLVVSTIVSLIITISDMIPKIVKLVQEGVSPLVWFTISSYTIPLGPIAVRTVSLLHSVILFIVIFIFTILVLTSFMLIKLNYFNKLKNIRTDELYFKSTIMPIMAILTLISVSITILAIAIPYNPIVYDTSASIVVIISSLLALVLSIIGIIFKKVNRILLILVIIINSVSLTILFMS